MLEILLTRHNHYIDPHLHIWEWQIPIYHFLGGLTAGLMILYSSTTILGREDNFRRSIWTGALLAPAALSLGMLMLLLDLTYKLHVFRFYMFFNPSSAMSWGAWILVLFYPANALFTAGLWSRSPVLPQPGKLPVISKVMSWAAGQRINIARVNLAIGIGLGIYTGVLLSTLTAMHLWNSGLMGPLFLVSGISSAWALSILVENNDKGKQLLRNTDKFLIIGELLLIGLLLIDLSSGCSMNRCAARFLISADYAPFFWVIVIGLGLVIPLVIESLSHKSGSNRISWLPPLLALGGGLALRFLFVLVGQAVVCAQMAGQ